MKKKKNGVILILGAAILVTTIHIGFLYNKDFSSQTITKSEKNNPVLKNESLSMMFETSAGSGEYEVRSDSTWPTSGYVFNASNSKCENGGTLSYDSSKNVVRMEASRSDKCYIYFDVATAAPKLAEYIKSLYTYNGANGLYYHEELVANSAGDNSYRYTGSNSEVNNYVCFGSSASTCPTENLYRIIGVFNDRVKLIKADYADSTLLGTDGDYQGTKTHNSSYTGSQTSWYAYYWNNYDSINAENKWNLSQLNKTNLNVNFLNNIGTADWSEKIDTTTWNSGGVSSSNGTAAAPTVYQYELGSDKSTTTYSGKIGLMYITDYLYAASQSNWASAGSSYNSSTANNWLYLGEKEWVISPASNKSDAAFYINNTGEIASGDITDFFGDGSGSYAVRPVFYLKNSVTYDSGTGSSTNPIRLK